MLSCGRGFGHRYQRSWSHDSLAPDVLAVAAGMAAVLTAVEIELIFHPGLDGTPNRQS